MHFSIVWLISSNLLCQILAIFFMSENFDILQYFTSMTSGCVIIVTQGAAGNNMERSSRSHVQSFMMAHDLRIWVISLSLAARVT